MTRDVFACVERCLICQQVKAEHQRPVGLLQPLEVPEWKLNKVAMDFMSGLPRTNRNNDSIWIVIDRLNKSAQFILVRTNYTLYKLAELYVKEIV